jgi:RNA polymerase sigma-70 factor (ECF subfamily)
LNLSGSNGPCIDVTQDVDVETDPSRIEAVYRAEAQRLRRSLLAFTCDASIANDAMAEAFAQALARGSRLREPSRWVWRAAFRIASGQMKDLPKQQGTEFGTLNDPGFEVAERSAELLAALAKLPTKQRAAVVLHYLADLPTAEVAKRLGVTSTTVRVHLNHGRARLRTILEEHDA